MRLLFAIAGVLVAVPVWAQRVEIAPMTLAGYTTAAPIDQTADGVEDLQLEGGFAWAAQGSYFFASRAGVEVWWRRQDSSMSLSSGTTGVALFDVDTDQIDANLVYRLRGGGAALVPFVSGGVGMTRLASDTLASETKFAWNAGGGVKWFFTRRFGARLDARYRATRLNTSTSDYCVPFGFCQGSLKTFHLTGGAELRF